MKLVELARKSIDLLKEKGEDGIRSDILADELGVAKRRVYDVIAILRAMERVDTDRRYNGTTVTWIDRSKNFVKKSDYNSIKAELEKERESRKKIQIELAEAKETLRRTKSRLRMDTKPVTAKGKTEFDTCQLRIRSLSGRGFKKVADSGVEAVIETYEPGMIVDPSEVERNRNEAILRNIQKL